MAESHGRTLIDTGTGKRYVRRDDQGQFKESDDVGRSLSSRRRRPEVEAGPGDRGDRKPPEKDAA